jgi:hypothetical protein
MSTDTRDESAAAPIHIVGSWPKWLRRRPLEFVASMLIGAGVLMLLQPLSLALYSYSFITTLAGVVVFTIVSKFPD